MPIAGGLDIHRKQVTSDYLDTETGQVRRGQVSPADRVHLRAWLARFHGRGDVAFALEGCTVWRYVGRSWPRPASRRMSPSGGHCVRPRPQAAPQAPLTRPPGSGSCRASGQGGPVVVRDLVQRFRRAAFLCGVMTRGGRGPGPEQPALPRSAGRWALPRRHDD